jgi:predicted amidohydrolase
MGFELCSLQFVTTNDYEANLQTLLGLIEKTPQESFIVAPEVCLSGFDYERFEELCAFAPYATEAIKKVSNKRTVICSVIEKIGNDVYNMVKVFHNGEIVHQRGKARLFRFGGEHNHFFEESDEKIELFEIDGVKVGVLVCFELRFKDLWKKLEGADIIAVPAWWGVLRTEHFKVLTQSLAIMNQCYVVASDSGNEDCTKQSAIITPFGEVARNENRACLHVSYDKKEVQRMRRYLDVGIG